MNLSEHFTLHELTKSAAATRLGIPNDPPERVVKNLKALCAHVLEPVRALVRANSGRPLFVAVSSGYRSAQVNRTIGGSVGSQHCFGEAADIEVPGLPNLQLARWIADSPIVFDQLILEFHVEAVPDSGWVHLSWREHKPRRQVLTATRERGSAVYRAGLPGRVPA